MVTLSTEIPNPNYWTPVAKTLTEQQNIEHEFSRLFNNTLRLEGLQASMRSLKTFYRTDRNTPFVSTIAYTLDSYSYSRSPNETVVNALLNTVGISQNSDQYRRSERHVEFMYRDSLFKIYYIGDGRSGARANLVYVDAGAESLYLGYDTLAPLINILFGGSGYYMNDDLEMMYKEGNQEFKIATMGEQPLRFLGMNTRAYGNALYANHRNVGELVEWLLEGRYVDFSNFYMTTGKEYIGPDDYFGSELFRQAVAFLRTADWDHIRKPTVGAETVIKHRLKLWESHSPTSFKEYIRGKEGAVKDTLISTKYNDAVIQEVTGLTPEAVATFKQAFESEIAAKSDFEFFVLSSSEETIKTRIAESHQRLTA